MIFYAASSGEVCPFAVVAGRKRSDLSGASSMCSCEEFGLIVLNGNILGSRD